MQPDTAEKLTRWIQNCFSDEQTKLHASLHQGVPPKEYQVQDTTQKALAIAMDILETFSSERDHYSTDEEVKQCLGLIQDRNENKWKALQKNERLQRMMAAVGFLAVDMGLPEQAEALFDILALMRPDDVNPLLGLAYSKLFTGSTHEALAVIRNKVLNMAPGNDLGLAFLALACSELNDIEEALAAAAAVITANRDESAVALAREIQRSLNQPACSDNMAY